MKNKIFTGLMVISALVGLGFAGATFAATVPQTPQGFGRGGFGGQGQFQGNMQKPRTPGVFGTVSAINGTNLTVASKGFGPNSATTTYSINASNAVVMANKATSTLSAITVGNSVSIQGTVNGTSVTATKINIGMGFGIGSGQNPGQGFNPKNASSTMQRKNVSSTTNMIQGNGQPIIGGTISVINGTTITISNKGNASYTIDASNATIIKGNSTSSVSNIVVGDSVLVQGTINGTSVTATTINDQVAVGHDANNGKQTSSKPSVEGFFGGIKSFFSRLFGF